MNWWELSMNSMPRALYHVSIWLIINLLWWMCLQHSKECHAPCSASYPSKSLLPWAALFTWANGFGLSWPAHPQLLLQCLGRSCLSKPWATQLWGDPQGNVSTSRELHWPCSPCGSPLKILIAALDLNFLRAFKNELRFNTCFCPFLKCSHHELLN